MNYTVAFNVGVKNYIRFLNTWQYEKSKEKTSNLRLKTSI